MQIKPIMSAAGTLACLILGWTAIAADTRNPSSVAKAEEAPTAKTEPAPRVMPEEQPMTKMEKPAAATSIRNTRPKMDRHRDARVCLQAVNNKAIIKCANKYR
jgi:hypothetical protein